MGRVWEPGGQLLKSLRLVKFRAFSDFTISFGEGAYLVGPNNAGKSTILTAIRTADALLRYAYRRKAEDSSSDGIRKVISYPVVLTEFPALQESLRYEFGEAEARLELTWKSGAKLTAVWPSEDDGMAVPFFYLETRPGVQVRSPAQAKAAFPQLGVIPILTPADTTEPLLVDTYVLRNVSGRLSSRHFRNQLRILKASDGGFEDFLDWAGPWLGDIRLDDISQRLESDGAVLDFFIYEGGSRVPKELVWAGDGIQIWLQLLYHVYRVADRDTIVLDEPDVYLHPDLQRRLVHLLESTGKQVILATHSSEMVAEADPVMTTLIDRSRKRAKRVADVSDLEMLSSALGTAFNLRLAKALRSKVAVFVEGQDLTTLRVLAANLGLNALAAEQGITVIPLQGYSNWGHVEPFAWLTQQLLPSALHTYVVLDRDYRSDTEVDRVEAALAAAGVSAHVWKRKELESYTLNPQVLARLTGVGETDVVDELNKVTAAMENEVFARLLDERVRESKSSTQHAVSIMTAFKPEFDRLWADPEFRLRTCPPKQVLAAFNTWLQASGKKAVSARYLARAHRADEIPAEMANLLTRINSAALA